MKEIHSKQIGGRENTQQHSAGPGHNIGGDYIENVHQNYYVGGELGESTAGQLLAIREINPQTFKQLFAQREMNEEARQRLEEIMHSSFLNDRDKIDKMVIFLDIALTKSFQGYQHDTELFWYYLDRTKLRDDFIYLIDEEPHPINNVRIMLFPDDDSAMSEEIPNMLAYWWKDAAGDSANQNIELTPIPFEEIDISDPLKKVQTYWFNKVYDRLSEKLPSLKEVPKRERSVDDINKKIAESPFGKNTVFAYQSIDGCGRDSSRLQEYLELWKQIQWPTLFVLVLFFEQYEERVTDDVGACFCCEPDRHYEKVKRKTLHYFYDQCKDKNWPYDTSSNFLENKDPIPFKNAVEQLRMVS